MRDYTAQPSYADTIAEVARRVSSLERSNPLPQNEHRVVQSFTSIPSLPWRPVAATSITDLWADASAAVAADTTFEVQRNGTAIGTVTIATGETTGRASLSPAVAVDVVDTVTVTRTAGGADASVQVLGTSGHPATGAVGGTPSAAIWAKLQGGVGTINSSPGSLTQNLAYVAGESNAYWEIDTNDDLKILTAGWYEIGGWGEFGDDFIAGDIAALQWGPSNMMVSVPAPGPSFGVSLATGPHYFDVNDVLSFTFTAEWSSGSQRTIDQNGDSWVWIRRMEGEYAAPGGGGGPG